MAWIEQTKNGCFRVGWREPSGRQRYRSFPAKEDAEAFQHEVDAGNGQLSARIVTLGEYTHRMLETAWNLRGSTIYGYQHVFDCHIARPLAGRAIGDISTEELRRFFSELKIGPSARASVYRLLARIFNQAVREGLLGRSQLRPIPKPKEQRKEIRPLSMEQIETLADHAALEFRVAILLAGYLGLRAGEVGGLRLQDVDFERGSLQVVQATRREGGHRMLGEVKTAAGRRRVSVPAFLLQEIREHVERFGVCADGRLFGTKDGGLVVNTVLSKALNAAARAAQIPAPRFHTLRHSAAAMMIAYGAHPKLIQARLGHSNIQVTLDVYGHLFPALDEELSAEIDRVRHRLIPVGAGSQSAGV